MDIQITGVPLYGGVVTMVYGGSSRQGGASDVMSAVPRTVALPHPCNMT